MTDVDRLRAAADRLDTYADDFHSREFHVVDDLDGFRCACGVPTLPDVTHSATLCAGRETLGDNA